MRVEETISQAPKWSASLAAVALLLVTLSGCAESMTPLDGSADGSSMADAGSVDTGSVDTGSVDARPMPTVAAVCASLCERIVECAMEVDAACPAECAASIGACPAGELETLLGCAEATDACALDPATSEPALVLCVERVGCLVEP